MHRSSSWTYPLPWLFPGALPRQRQPRGLGARSKALRAGVEPPPPKPPGEMWWCRAPAREETTAVSLTTHRPAPGLPVTRTAGSARNHRRRYQRRPLSPGAAAQQLTGRPRRRHRQPRPARGSRSAPVWRHHPEKRSGRRALPLPGVAPPSLPAPPGPELPGRWLHRRTSGEGRPLPLRRFSGLGGEGTGARHVWRRVAPAGARGDGVSSAPSSASPRGPALPAAPPPPSWASPGSTCGTGRPRSSGWWPAPGATWPSWGCAVSGAAAWPCRLASTSSSGTRGKERRWERGPPGQPSRGGGGGAMRSTERVWCVVLWDPLK